MIGEIKMSPLQLSISELLHIDSPLNSFKEPRDKNAPFSFKELTVTQRHLYLIGLKLLKEDLKIPPKVEQDLQTLLPLILSEKLDKKIIWLTRGGHNLIFSLTSDPRFVFKFAKKGSLTAKNLKSINRFNNMVFGKKICLSHQFEHLVIPKARIITIYSKKAQEPHLFIAEERLSVPSNYEEVKKSYLASDDQIKIAIKELTAFISLTRLTDIYWRNIPILEDTKSSINMKKIALVDLETLGEGYFEETGLYELIDCLFSESDIRTVIEEAKRINPEISLELLTNMLKARMASLFFATIKRQYSFSD